MTLPTSLVPMSIEAEDWEREGEELTRKKEKTGRIPRGMAVAFLYASCGATCCFSSKKKKSTCRLGCLQEGGHLIFPIGYLLCSQLIGYVKLSRSKTKGTRKDKSDGGLRLWTKFLL